MNESTRWCSRVRFAACLAGSVALSLLASAPARADAVFPHLSAGGYHTCDAKQNGTLWCWGFNEGGQIGDGTTVDKYYPWQVTAMGSSVVEVAAGFDFTCARKNDGTLWCWGYNYDGEIGDGTNTTRTLPVQVTALGNNVAGISTGDQHTCARRTDGTIWCWGNNAYGQLGNGTTTSSSTPVQISASGFFIEISAGGYQTCARTGDGTLWCWGENNVGQVGDGTTTNRLTPVQVTGLPYPAAEISAGEDHTCARLTDGSLWCWGWNYHAQLGDGSHTDSWVPINVDRLGTSVTQVSTGRDFTCARKTDFSLWCWGYNDYGELGSGNTLEETIPTAVVGLPTVKEVSGGQYFTCADDYTGLTWCWGSNLTGQLGNGTTTSSYTPVQAYNFLDTPVPASNLASNAALAVALLLSGVAWVGRRRRRADGERRVAG
jgi:alpha-tubulin suppressor-like RCC1 family protein